MAEPDRNPHDSETGPLSSQERSELLEILAQLSD